MQVQWDMARMLSWNEQKYPLITQALMRSSLQVEKNVCIPPPEMPIAPKRDMSISSRVSR